MSDISNSTSRNSEKGHKLSRMIDRWIDWLKEPRCFFCWSTELTILTKKFDWPDRYRCDRCRALIHGAPRLVRRLLQIRDLNEKSCRILKMHRIHETPKDDCSRPLRGQGKAIEAGETYLAGDGKEFRAKFDKGLRESGKHSSTRVYKRKREKGAYMLHV